MNKNKLIPNSYLEKVVYLIYKAWIFKKHRKGNLKEKSFIWIKQDKTEEIRP